MHRKVLLPFFFLCLLQNSYGQNLLSLDLVDTYTQAELPGITSIEANFDVELYYVLYETTDVNDEVVMASGVFAYPVIDGQSYSLPTLLYEHGTAGSKSGVASEDGNELSLILGYASQGFMTVAPDLLGLGASPGFHPYLDARTEASASIDMLNAIDSVIESTELDDNTKNGQLFITGYSGGAHASMASHKALEEGTETASYEIIAAAHSSGPYSLSGEMVDFTLGGDVYIFPGFLPYVAVSLLLEADPLYDDLEQMFKPQYVGPIQQFQNWDIDLLTLNFSLAATLTVDAGGLFPAEMLQDSIADALLTNPDHPASQALQANDLYDWAPQAITRMFYCTSDEIVTFTNSTLAETTMNDNGAADTQAIDVDPDSGHGDCVPFAVTAALDLFTQYAEINNITSTKETAGAIKFDLFPNPSAGNLRISLPEELGAETLQIFDWNGRLIHRQSINQSELSLNFPNLANGMYAVQIQGQEGNYRQTWIKN
ncbi:MAG: T9SS type A sorting domain-containing protein [Bacteroidota bacterium]